MSPATSNVISDLTDDDIRTVFHDTTHAVAQGDDDATDPAQGDDDATDQGDGGDDDATDPGDGDSGDADGTDA